MIDFREEREKELKKFYEMEPKPTTKWPKPGEKFTSIEQLPKWFTKNQDPRILKSLIKGMVAGPDSSPEQ